MIHDLYMSYFPPTSWSSVETIANSLGILHMPKDPPAFQRLLTSYAIWRVVTPGVHTALNNAIESHLRADG